jgi:hypothetical protein
MNERQTAQLEIIEQLLSHGETAVDRLSLDGYSKYTANRVLKDLEDIDFTTRETEQSHTWYIGPAGVDLLARNEYDYPDHWHHRIHTIETDAKAREYYNEHDYDPGVSVYAERYQTQHDE